MARKKQKQSSGTIRIKNGRVVSFDLHGPVADAFAKGMMKACEDEDARRAAKRTDFSKAGQLRERLVEEGTLKNACTCKQGLLPCQVHGWETKS